MQLSVSQIDFLGKIIKSQMTATEIQNLDPSLKAIWDSASSTGWAHYSAKPHAVFYLALAEIVKDQPGVDKHVELWLRGAADVNVSGRGQAEFIHEYNNAQATARDGGDVTVAEMNAISDELARNVFDNIERTSLVSTISQIAGHDAKAAADNLYGDLGVRGFDH